MAKQMIRTVDAPRPESFFNLIFKKKLTIPPYQRFYTWDKDLVLQLISDINSAIKSKRKMYLGTIIVKPADDKNWHVIDGQQRILTLVILLRALRSSGKLSAENERMVDDWFNGTTIHRVEIDLNEEIRNEYFKDAILDGKIVDFEKYKQHKYADKINLSLKTFTEEFRGKKQKDINSLFDFLRDHIEVIAILLDHEADESDVFESINSKRMELTSADLIKNFILSRSAKNSELILRNWDNFYKTFNEDQIFQKFFDYFCDSLSKRDTNTKDTYKCFKEIFRKEYKSSVEKCMAALQIYATNYRILKQGLGDRTKAAKDASVSIECINYLKFTTQTPLLLKVLGLGVRPTSSDFVKVLKLVEIIQFLHQEIDEKMLPQGVKDYLYQMMWSMRKKSDIKKLIKDLLKKKHTLLSETNISKIGQLRIENTRSQKAINYLLYRVFQKSSSSILKVSLDSLNSSIEHIIPQTRDETMSSLNKDWQKVLKDDLGGDAELRNQVAMFKEKKERVKYYYENIVQSVGNLALLSAPENASVSDRSFGEKRKHYILTEKKNVLFDFVIGQSRWNISSVRKNGAITAKRYLAIFK